MKNTSNSYLKLLLGTSMIKHRKCTSLLLIDKAVGSFIDYQYRGSCSKQYLKLVRQTPCTAKYIFYSLHLSLLFIPTTNFTAVCARVEE